MTIVGVAPQGFNGVWSMRLLKDICRWEWRAAENQLTS